MTLSEFFHDHPRVAVAFSGGVDSAYLLCAAKASGAEVHAYLAHSAFQPHFELEDARAVAAALDVKLHIIAVDVLSNRLIADNPPNRCYYCKRQILGAILHAAHADGFPILLDGTNASDQEAERPGMTALRELGVRSPLRECGLTKADIRRLSREAGLFTWDKPAYACLATRTSPGEPITAETLAATERAEDFLRRLGFSDFRVRRRQSQARLQLRSEQFALLLSHREEILATLKPDFEEILLDLEARK